jgi:hypothetical protein
MFLPRARPGVFVAERKAVSNRGRYKTRRKATVLSKSRGGCLARQVQTEDWVALAGWIIGKTEEGVCDQFGSEGGIF